MQHDSCLNRQAGELDTGFGDQGQLTLASRTW